MEPNKQKILFVDLTNETIKTKVISEAFRKKFVGGRGIGGYLIYKHIKAGIDPFGPDNYLSIDSGPLAGTGLPCGSRTHVCAKSPLTDGFGSTNMGGEFSPELRWAGYDHILVSGKAKHPVYLYIKDDQVEIRDASMLWGETTSQTERIIREMHNDQEIKTLVIGPGGENMVRYGCVICPPKNAGGRTGMGGVMGSKNLKAVAVKGTKGLKLNNPLEFLKLRREIVDQIMRSKAMIACSNYGTMFVYSISNAAGQIRNRNFQNNQMVNGRDLEPETFKEKYELGPIGCVGCPIHCRTKYVIPYGEHKGKITEGPEYTYLGAYGTEVDNPRLDVVLAAGYEGNEYGIDCLEYGSMLSWAMELYEKGLITKEDTGGIALEWGDPDVIIGMIKKVALREGFGDVLADGPKRAIERLGEKTRYYNINVKGMSNLHSDERSIPSFALGIGVSTRGSDHLRSRPALDLANLPAQVLKKLYTVDVVNDYQKYETKEKVVSFHEECYAVADCTGLCKTPSVFFTPHLLSFKEYARMLTEVAGISFTYEEMRDVGRRVYTLERLFNIREGMSRKDDYLSERYYVEPTPLGQETNRGKTIDREKYDKMLDAYYDWKGWDRDGNPTPETLKKIGLDDLEETSLI
jgi:aldehyde:ferredoxin oxidoreductase